LEVTLQLAERPAKTPGGIRPLTPVRVGAHNAGRSETPPCSGWI
jgi:hypothetical protein